MSESFDDLFAGTKVLGIFRGSDPARTVDLCHRAWDAGVRAVEIPVQDEPAFASLEAAVNAGRERGRSVGAGTVRSRDQLRRVIDLGAEFTVAPGFDVWMVESSMAWGIPHLPGVATASEIHHALNAGVIWMKAFPAAQLGASWIRAQRAPFPTARFVATGGINATNAAEFLDAGCEVVAIGSAFEDDGQLDALRAGGLLS